MPKLSQKLASNDRLILILKLTSLLAKRQEVKAALMYISLRKKNFIIILHLLLLIRTFQQRRL